MTSVLITAPAGEPVSLAEAKTHLRLDTSDEDAFVDSLIAAARSHAEKATGRALIHQVWRVYYDDLPTDGRLKVPLAPIASVDALTVYDGDGDPILIDAADYQVDSISFPGRVAFLNGGVTPGRPFNGIELDVTAGYGPDAGDIPADLRQAILALIAHWYEHREAVSDGALETVPIGYLALIKPYRVVRL